MTDGACPISAYCTKFETAPANDGWETHVETTTPNGIGASPLGTPTWEAGTLGVDMPPAKDWFARAYWYRGVPTMRPPFRVSFDFYYEGPATTVNGTAGAAPAFATLRFTHEAVDNLASIDLAILTGQLAIRTFLQSGNEPNRYLTFPTTVFLAAGSWQRVKIEVDGPSAVKVQLGDGPTVATNEALDPTLFAAGPGIVEVALGVEYAELSNAPLKQRFDNFVIEQL